MVASELAGEIGSNLDNPGPVGLRWKVEEPTPLAPLRTSMRKTREILRLHFLGLKQRQIARSCSIAQSTVNACLQAAKAAGVTWPEVANWDYLKLESALLGELPSAVARRQKTRT
jgi:hypothetical protein